MAQRAAASGFVPGGYLFFEAGDGAGQADFFHATAGDMTGFAIAIDVEPASGSEPTAADAPLASPGSASCTPRTR